MNQIQEILLELQQLDIKLWVEEGRLLYDAPKGVMTPSILSQIKQKKSEITSFLEENSLQQISSIPTISRNQELPLSFAQERLWFIDQFQGPSPVYNIDIILKLQGPLNLQALEKAITDLFQRHESLRTNFKNQEGKLQVIIHPVTNFCLPIVNLEHLNITEQKREIEKLIEQETSHGFDLEKETLARFTLLKIEPQKHILITLMHHIITDGWSMGILTKELAHLYQAYSKNVSSSLSSLPIQYVDFAVWQREHLADNLFKSKLSYWQGQLKNIPPILHLPIDKPRPKIQNFKGAIKEFYIEPYLTKKLKILSQQNNVTLFITLLSIFSILLFRYSNQKDFLIGSPVANRNHQDIEGLIGFFVNILPLRINLNKNITFSELLQQVKTTALNAYEHQDLPFEKLVEKLKVERNLGHHPLFQVMFALQNIPDIRFDLEGLELELVPFKRKTTKFDLSLLISEKEEQLQFLWEYKTDLFNLDTIERMSGHFQTLVAGIISNSQQKISLQDPAYREWERVFVTPRTPIEKIVKEIWSEVLGMEQIGINDNFFELGGNSVMVTQVLSRIEAKFPVQLPIQSFFESPTVESLAIAILENQTAKIDEQELIALLERLENED